MTNLRYISFILVILFALPINAENAGLPLEFSDSVVNLTDSIIQPQAQAKKKNIFQKFIAYFGDANKERPEKKFDINFIGGPFYSSDVKFGIGFVGAGQYKLAGAKNLQPSNVAIFGSLSTAGFIMLGVRGSNLFPEDKYRLNYTLYFYQFPTAFWGIGYDRCNNKDNVTGLRRFQVRFNTEFLFRVAKNFYLGPAVTWDYIHGSKVNQDKLYLFEGQPLTLRNYGFGATFSYDTRDVMTNAYKGVYLYWNQRFRPSWLGNSYAFSTSEFKFYGYQRLWKGAILAGAIDATFNFGNPSWAMMAKFANGAMRGYYDGRYRDKHSASIQVELRQHVWRRNGIVVWCGIGSVFHDKQSFKNILPDFGIGYRWEFKKRMNVRLDYGFGRGGQKSFAFGINEAF